MTATDRMVEHRTEEREQGPFASAVASAASRKREISAVGVAVFALTLLTVYAQEQQLGLEYLRTTQLRRHNEVLQNIGPTPWQYRPFAVWVNEALLTVARRMGAPDPVVFVFLGVRLLQNALLFTLTALYLRALDISRIGVLVGLAMLVWSMGFMFDSSDLSFSTFYDAIFYLLGTLLLLRGRVAAIVPLVAVASLNRETIALLPAMVLCLTAMRHGWRALPRRKEWWIAIAAGAAWLIVYVGLRAWFGPRPWSAWTMPAPGLPMLLANLGNAHALMLLGMTLNLLPLVVLLGFRRVSLPVRAFGLALVPVWVLVHIVMVPLNETRIFLVPIILFLLPAALLAAGLRRADSVPASAP